MVKAIALYSVVPIRSEASEAAEQETQMLFSETCTVLEEQPRWLFIKSDLDGQTGWADRKMLTIMNEQEWESIRKAPKTAIVCMPVAYAVSIHNNQTIPLTAGTRLLHYHDGSFELLGASFRIDPSMVADHPLEMTIESLQQVIRFFLNTPYLWGGKNAFGMDCSGFTQIIYSIFGRALMRNASEQATQGQLVADLLHVEAGDLAFFDHHDGKISHVGILLDSERIVHCSGRVKVEHINEEGIRSQENGNTYTHHLVCVRHIE